MKKNGYNLQVERSQQRVDEGFVPDPFPESMDCFGL